MVRPFSDFREGDVVEGTVLSVNEYGADVDIGGPAPAYMLEGECTVRGVRTPVSVCVALYLAIAGGHYLHSEPHQPWAREGH